MWQRSLIKFPCWVRDLSKIPCTPGLDVVPTLKVEQLGGTFGGNFDWYLGSFAVQGLCLGMILQILSSMNCSFSFVITIFQTPQFPSQVLFLLQLQWKFRIVNIILRISPNSPMISPYSFLTISLLLIFANSQFCCKDSSACPSQASCLCQYPIDSCIFEIIENSLSFPVTTSQSYFNWVPSTNEYISVTIEICSENKDSLKAGFKIQNQDAKGYPTESNIFFSTSTQKCYELYIASPKFCQSPSGGYCNLILSLALTNSSSLSNKTVQISVSYVQGLTKYIVFILIAIGCVLLLAIIILLACMIRKKMVENSVVEKKQIYTIDHLEQHTSKGKYSDLKKEVMGEREGEGSECCSVCLTQIQNEDIVRKTPCGHIFHTDCVDLWCIRNLTCPICREPLDQQSLKKKTSLKTQELSLNQLMIPMQQNQQLNERVGATLNNLIHRRNRITMVDLIRNRRNEQNSVEGNSNCQ